MNTVERRLLASLRRRIKELEKQLRMSQQIEEHYQRVYVEERQLHAELRSKLRDIVEQFE